MGFADMSIADLAEDYNLEVAQVIALCEELKIPYRNAETYLALEDAKSIINRARAATSEQA
ncbi:MAG: translation initiation factor IF-2 [Cyanobacteria bacterium J06642_2]